MIIEKLKTLARAIPARNCIKDLEIKRILDALAQVIQHILDYLNDVDKSTKQKRDVSVVSGSAIRVDSLPNKIYRVNFAGPNYQESKEAATIRPTMSIIAEGDEWHLDNDKASPAANYVYGVDAFGKRGWRAAPISLEKPNTPVPASGDVLMYNNTPAGWTAVPLVTLSVIVGLAYDEGSHTLTARRRVIAVPAIIGDETSEAVFTTEVCPEA